MEVNLGATGQGLSPTEIFSSAAPATVTVTASIQNNYVTSDGFPSYPSTVVETYYVQPSGYSVPTADPSSASFVDAANAQYLSAASTGSNPSVLGEPTSSTDEINSYPLSTTTPWWGSSSITPYTPSSSLSWNPNVNTDLGSNSVWDENFQSVTPSLNSFSSSLGLNFITDSSSSAYVDPSSSAYVDPSSSAYAGFSSSAYVDPSSSAYAGFSSSAYVDPSSNAYVDPSSSAYAGFSSSAYVDPSSNAYVDPSSSAYAGFSPSAYVGPSSSAYAGFSSSAYVDPSSSAYAGFSSSAYADSSSNTYADSSSNTYADSSSSAYAGSSIGSDWWQTISRSFYGSSSGIFSTWTPTYSSVIPSATSSDILNSLSSIVYDPSTQAPSNDIQNTSPYTYPSLSSTLQLGGSSASGSNGELNNVDISSSPLSVGETSAYSSSSQYPSVEGSSYPSPITGSYASVGESYFSSSYAAYNSIYPTLSAFSSSYSGSDSTSSPLSGWYSSWFLSPPLAVLPSASSGASIVTTPYPSVASSSIFSFSAPRPPISPSTPAPTAFTSELSTFSIPTLSTYSTWSSLVDTTNASPSSYEANPYSSSEWQYSVESEITPFLGSSLAPTLVTATSNIVPTTTSILPAPSAQVTGDASGFGTATSSPIPQQSNSYFDSFTTTPPAVYSSIAQTPVVASFTSDESTSTVSSLAGIENIISPSVLSNPSSPTNIGSTSVSFPSTSASSPLSLQAISASSSSSSLKATTTSSSSGLQAISTSSSSSLEATTTSSSSGLRTITTSSSSRSQTTTTSSSLRLQTTTTFDSSSKLQLTISSSSSSTSSALKTSRSLTSFFSKQSPGPYFPISSNSSSYRSSSSSVLSHNTSSTLYYNTTSSTATSPYKSLAPSQSRNNTYSRSSSSINTGYSVSYGTKTAYYIYTQSYVITGSSTTFGTGIPTTINEPRSMTPTFSAPQTVITQNMAFYDHWLNNLRGGNSHHHSHTGAIVGGVVGGVCGFVVGCLVIATLFLLHRLRKRKNAEDSGDFAGEIGNRMKKTPSPAPSTDNLQEKPDDPLDNNPHEEDAQLPSISRPRRVPHGSLEGERTSPENPFRDEFNFNGRSPAEAESNPPPVPPPRKMHSTSQHPIQSRNANPSRDVRSSLVSSIGDSSFASSLQGDCSTLSSGAIRLEPSNYGSSIPEDPAGGFFREVI